MPALLTEVIIMIPTICVTVLCNLLMLAKSSQVIREEFYYPSTVSEYVNYGSISLFRFELPESVVEALWSFTMMKSDDSCADQDIHISIHIGAPPVVNPYNESLPVNADVRYSTGLDFTYNTADTDPAPAVSLSSPEAGNWFVIAYRLKEGVEKIDQKGIGEDCRYKLQPTLVFNQVVDIPILSELAENMYSIADNYVLLRYHTKFSSSVIKFEFTDCSSLPERSPLAGNCPLNVTVGAGRLPTQAGGTHSCLGQARCTIVISDALKGSWYYLKVETSAVKPFTLKVWVKEEGKFPLRGESVSSRDCMTGKTVMGSEDVNTFDPTPWPMLQTQQSLPCNYSHVSTDISYVYSDLHSGEEIAQYRPADVGLQQDAGNCAPLYTLMKLYSSGTKRFLRMIENDTDVYPLERHGPLLVTFDIDPVEDVGGFLAVGINAATLPYPSVRFCMRKNGPPVVNGLILNCTDDIVNEGNLTSTGKGHWYFPNPVAGTWYLGLEVECYNASAQDPSSCGEDAGITMSITINEQCINNCGSNGQCYVRNTAGVLFYYCKCYYGYSGLSCSDDSAAWSKSYYLTRVLLLTLSNGIFLIASIFAIYKHHFAESVAFIATTIFSTLYHACDSSRVCVLDYDTLQFCDFYACFLSVVLTLIAMAKLNPTLKSTFHMIGAIFVAFAAKYDRFSLWAILVPLSAGLVVVLVSWGLRMYRRRELYPSKKRWIFFIVPGTVLALLGLVFTALETDENYYIMHSIWHVCIGASVLFLLPPRPAAEKELSGERELLDVSTSLRDYHAPNDDPEPYSFMTGE